MWYMCYDIWYDICRLCCKLLGYLKLTSELPKRQTFKFPSAVILSRLQPPQK